MNLQTFIDAIPSFLWSDGNGAASGLAVTAELFLLSIVPGMALAIAMAVGQVYGPRGLALPIRAFTYFFRSRPRYLQLLLIYYGLSQFDIVQTGWMNDQPFWLLFRDATFCATLALVLNTAAYVAELLAGMMVTFPRQEWVAGEAYGMGKWQIIRRLVLPATLRRGIPALNNEMVFLLQLSHFHFGAPGTGEKVYLQAGLHADEIPGMLVLHYLKRLLSQAERRGELRGEIILVPVANPPGLAQVLLSGGVGRFDLASGRNFNRDFPDLAALAQPYLRPPSPGSRREYLQQVRAAMRDALAALPVVSEVQALRHHLLGLACDADLVLDLHCDDQAILHLYADPAWQREAKVLAAFLGVGAVLLSQESGGHSFDEDCGLPWQRLTALDSLQSQQQPGCMAVTVELRGQQEVDHATACDDAERLYRYLQYRGVLAGSRPEIPQQETVILPFAAGEIVTAPATGILVL